MSPLAWESSLMRATVRGVQLGSIPAKGQEQPGGGFHLKPMSPWVPRGAYAFPEVLNDRRYLVFVCPCGCFCVHRLLIVGPGDPEPPEDCGPRWRWDGSPSCPTLTPSVNMDRACGWHGFLRAGTWEHA